ncbi:phosphodiester glycosidase family protein [Rhizobium sp. BK251]|uniref:phosphodiester glycosidase family protein n=1 Tax=Rhizobium sp. BK251 TaxID=2512125 RepID=UPI0010521B1E|nr:phosphodiester glycosidase family protein [Rhizobium sp. BK251]
MFGSYLAGHPAIAGDHCRRVAHLGHHYIVCSFDPAAEELRLYHADASGKPYGSFQAMLDDIEPGGTNILFAMNAGMYHADLSAVGLYVEGGVEQQQISTGRGWGNFHLLPNGVFYLAMGKAGVVETRAYLDAGIKPRFATQSGPMLVIDGKIHPRFLPHSDSLNVRNGVGVDANGIVHAVISEDPIRFYDFALLFRDVLGCDNALFLDGSISSLYAPEINRHDRLFPVGPIFAVVAPVAK